MTRDWLAWHRAYDDPTSSLSLRRRCVVTSIREHLDHAPSGEIKVLSLCAGDAQDLVLAAQGHARAEDLVGAVVELDPTLAATAADSLRVVAPRVDVVVADAGVVGSYARRAPVDVLLLCGIFGNVTDDDIHRTVAAVPTLCRPAATVVWTRHRRAPDLTPSIRGWFDAAGCEMVRFDSPGDAKFAVGTERFVGSTSALDPTATLFEFRTDLW